MSTSGKGRVVSQETKNKLTGRIVSPETRAKLSAIAKARHAASSK